MKAKSKIWRVVLAAMVGGMLAYFIAGIAIDRSEVHSEWRISFQSKKDQKLIFSAIGEQAEMHQKLVAIEELFLTYTLEFKFNFPAKLSLIATDTSHDLSIRHMGLKTQKTYQDWHPQEILDHFNIVGAIARIDQNNLVLSDFSANGKVEFTLKDESKFIAKTKQWHQQLKVLVGISAALLIAIFMIVVLLNIKFALISAAASLVPALLAFGMFNFYGDVATPSELNAKIYVGADTISARQSFPIREPQNLFFEAPKKLSQYDSVELEWRHGWLHFTFDKNEVDSLFRYFNRVYVKNGHFENTGKDNRLMLSDSTWVNRFKLVSLMLQGVPVLALLAVFLLNFALLQWLFLKSKNVAQLSFNALMINFFAIPLMGFLIGQPVYVFASENRNAAPKPHLSQHFVDSFPKSFDRYFQDQFTGREFFLEQYKALDNNLFNGLGAAENMVVKGKDGWWFYNDEGSLDYYLNKQPFTEEELETIAENLLERQSWLQSRGIDFYLLIAPFKPTIYNEYLPDDIVPENTPSRTESVINYLKANTNIKLIDIKPTLMNAKKIERIYYQKDTHWNLAGGFYAYQTIIDSIRKYHPEISAPRDSSDFNRIKTTQNAGDLAHLLGEEKNFPRVEDLLYPKIPYKYVEAEGGPYPESSPEMATIFKKIPDSNLPKLFMHRDSYSNFLIPYLSDHFSASTYYWSPFFFDEVIEEENPDIVVTEILERFIENYLEPNSPRVKAEYARKQKQN